MPGASRVARSAYLILRVVPSVERGERVNVGVVLFCRQRGFLGARVDDRRARGWRRSAPTGIDVRRLEDHLDALVRVAEGAPDAGPVAALDPSERFGWLARTVEHDRPALGGPHRSV